MIDKERIKAEAEAFFEWPSKEKTYVTTTSMLIFANVIAEMARAEEREACAKVCEQQGRTACTLLFNEFGDPRFIDISFMPTNASVTGEHG